MSLDSPGDGTGLPAPRPAPENHLEWREEGDLPPGTADALLAGWEDLAAAAGSELVSGEILTEFLQRMAARVRELRASAGVTWPDYTFPEGAFVAEVTATGSHGRRTWTFPPHSSFEDVASSLGKHEAGS
jgi:hypothetical protein